MARIAPRVIFYLLSILVLSSPLRAQTPNNITYVYDELGRLIAVVDPTQDTVTYSYDAVGNVLSISRYSSSVVSIIKFTPSSGSVGAPVTIYGTSFSATPNQNTVTFNGVAATVGSSSPTQITTTVPAGATTGLITVTSPAGSATSSAAFTVSASPPGAPTITSFSPAVGTAGTALTLTGTNFNTVAANNKVKLNISRSTTSSSTATSIATTVPSGVGSGRVSVTTSVGNAVSSGDFFVPPSPYLVGDLEATDRMAIGGSKTVAISTANKIGLIVFDATATQSVSLKITSMTMSSVSVSINDPYGTSLASTSYSGGTNGSFIDARTLPVAGTYTIVIDPIGTTTGNVSFNLYNVVDIIGTISTGGASVGVTITTPGQNGRFTFNGNAGQRLSVGLSGVTFPTNGSAIYIYNPDGTTLASDTNVSSLGDATDFSLPVTGAYTILADATGDRTGSMTLTLSEEVTGTIAIAGPPLTVDITRPGQRARITFDGTAGQHVSLQITNVTFPTGGSAVSIYKPDGTLLASDGNIYFLGDFIDTNILPATGAYTILVDPYGSRTGSMRLTLYEVPADVTGTITIGGAPITVMINTPGQNGSLSFSGTSGQRISLRMTSVSIPSSTVYIYNPDASTLGSAPVPTSGGYIDLKILPATGTYTIFINPEYQYTGNMTLTLYEVPADVTGTVTIGGTSLTVNLNTPGQNAQLTFAGTSGQQATVRVTGNTISSVTVKLLKPDGSQLTSLNSSSSSFNLATQTLPTTGTYTIVIDPGGANTGSLTVSVTSP